MMGHTATGPLRQTEGRVNAMPCRKGQILQQLLFRIDNIAAGRLPALQTFDREGMLECHGSGGRTPRHALASGARSRGPTASLPGTGARNGLRKSRLVTWASKPLFTSDFLRFALSRRILMPWHPCTRTTT